MRYILMVILVVVFSTFLYDISYADEDIFGDYYKDTRKPAEANATNVYNAWGDNMANMIERGYRDGVVIDGPGEYSGGKVRADGVGNVVIDKNANIGNIINKTKIKDSTIIIKNDSSKNRW